MKRTLLVLALAILGLLAIGLVLLASAGGAVPPPEYNGEPLAFLWKANPHLCKQAMFLGVAIVPFGVAFFLDYHIWQKKPWLTVALYVVVAVMLVAVLFMSSAAHKGSHRWIDLGVMQIQPSEIAKIATIIVTAVFLDRARWKVELFWKGAIPAAAIFGIFAGLILKEPDFGSTVIVGVLGLALMWVAGVKFWHILLLAPIGAVFVVGYLIFNQNRMRRLLAHLPESIGNKLIDALNLPFDAVADEKIKNAVYQKQQSIIAIQRGGITGVGFNQSQQKHQFLPERHTDFIFAIGAEEWGLVFSLALLALFVTIFVCGIMISLHAPDRLGQLIASGVTFLIFLQAVCNMGVVSGVLPTKGLALPFISYGGTNLVMSLTAMGLLFGVGRRISLQNQLRRSKISAVLNNN